MGGCCCSNPATNISPDTPWKNVLIARSLKPSQRTMPDHEIGEYEFNLFSKKNQWNKFESVHFDWWMYPWPEYSQQKRQYFMLRENDYKQLLAKDLKSNNFIQSLIKSTHILIECKKEHNIDVICGNTAYPTRFKKVFLCIHCMKYMANKLAKVEIEQELDNLIQLLLETWDEFKEISQTQIDEMCQLIHAPYNIKTTYDMKKKQRL